MSLEIIGILCQTIHLRGETLVVCYFQTTVLLQTLCLLELLVVRAEEHWYTPYGGLQQIMDAYTKTATDVCHIAIAINARQQSEAVDDEDVIRSER